MSAACSRKANLLDLACSGQPLSRILSRIRIYLGMAVTSLLLAAYPEIR